MGNPAPSAEALVQENTTVDTVATAIDGLKVEGLKVEGLKVEGFVVKKGELFLGDHDADARFGALGHTTYVYATAGEAEETFERSGDGVGDPEVVPVRMTLEFI